jgi:hypothetical protein
VIITRKWLVCDVCGEPAVGDIGNDTTAAEARRTARRYYWRRKGRDVCVSCLADVQALVDMRAQAPKDDNP